MAMDGELVWTGIYWVTIYRNEIDFPTCDYDPVCGQIFPTTVVS